MLRFTLALLAVVALTLSVLWMTGLLSWSIEQSGGSNTVSAENRPTAITIPYQTHSPAALKVSGSVSAILPDPIVITDATLAPVQEAEVPSRVDGQLVQLYVRLGDRLSAGSPIAQLDDTLARPEMEIARIRAENTAEVEGAKLVYEVYKLYVEKSLEANRLNPGTVPLIELRIQEAQRDKYYFEWVANSEKLRAARQEFEQKRRLWELHQVRSPIPGEVTRIFKNTGEGVKAGETIVHIANYDRLYVEAAIPLPMRALVRPGMRGLVEPERPQGWLRELRGHTGTITGITTTPDGRFLLSCGEDGRVVLWDWQFFAQRPIELRDPRFSREFAGLVCSPIVEKTGQDVTYTVLVGGADGRIRRWQLTVSSQGRLQNQTLTVFGEVTPLHRSPIRCLAISPDNALLASGSEDGEIVITSLQTAQPILNLRDPNTHREPAHRAAVTSLNFSPEGDLVSAGQDGTLARWRLGKDANGQWAGELVWRAAGRTADISQLGISQDGKRGLFETGEELRIVDLNDARTLAVISSRRLGQFRSVALFSPDNRMVLTTTASGRLHLWNVPPTQEESAWLRLAYQRGFKYNTTFAFGVLSAALTPHGAEQLPGWLGLALPNSASGEGNAHLLVSDPAIAPLPVWHDEPTTQIPELWPVDSRELRVFTMPDPSTVTCAAFSPDGRFCFTGGSDKVIRVWPTPPVEECIRPLEGRLIFVGQQVESGAGLVRIRAEMHNPQRHASRLLPGTRVTVTVFPEFVP